MTILPPWVALSVLMTAGFAALFHLWGGRTLGDLVVYWLAATVGFAIGQTFGQFLQAPLPQIGEIRVIEASVLAWVAMVGARELGVGHTEAQE
jgi:uncharacterized membrane-anchored protein